MNQAVEKVKPAHALLDLVIFLAVMFLVREIHIDAFGFWGYALFKSCAAVGVASFLLYYRKQSWKDLGFKKPHNFLKSLGITFIVLAGTIISIMIFEVLLRDILFGSADEVSKSQQFNELKGNIPYLFSILPFVWIESFLEELQDRGFSLNRFEALLKKIPLSTLLAVLVQAAIFGFRHSYEFSPRFMTTTLIGFIFGLVYVLSGRNLWPLIIAHIILNTLSMIERV